MEPWGIGANEGQTMTIISSNLKWEATFTPNVSFQVSSNAVNVKSTKPTPQTNSKSPASAVFTPNVLTAATDVEHMPQKLQTLQNGLKDEEEDIFSPLREGTVC